jgi:subtilase family serine protease
LKRTLFLAVSLAAGIAFVTLVALALAGGRASAPSALPVPTPAVDLAAAKQVSVGPAPPTEAQCEAVGRTCFTPQAIQSAYDLGPVYAAGETGAGMTIAIVDSYGSDTMAHDLHVFDTTFGIAPMCGEEGVTCTAGMPKFSVLSLQGSPATKAPPATSKGPGLENKAAWALEVSLDVETAHAIAPGANILLVTTPTAETLGVQGFPQMMNSEQYVVDNHLAQVISQSFASAEDAFSSTQSLLNLRHAYISASQNHVTVVGASGDNGTANLTKHPVSTGGALIPYPTVEWPASDPLVTGIGGTYLCTNPLANTNDPRTLYPAPAGRCKANPTQTEVGWTFSGGGFSHVFSTPSWQTSLPAGSTPIGSMRGVPDVAFQASAGTGALVYLSLPPDGNDSDVTCGGSPCSPGWWDIGGTSLSTPQWAGLVAIADQMNGGGLGLINPALYKIASNPAQYAADFFDVTTGNNTQAGTGVAGYPATTGWDPVTGLGTPNAAKLLPDLVFAVNH